MEYFKYNEQEISDFSDENIENQYNNGFVFTRVKKGNMNQVRSLRINLLNFEFNSENRRVLRKTESLELSTRTLPIHEGYDFRIHMTGKEFYSKKSQKDVFSASKIKELVTDETKSNFNELLEFKDENQIIGYTICLKTNNILHYAYPFYDLKIDKPNIGMGMILKAIEYSKTNNHKYFYLGSVSSQKSLYKLQFNNVEWWDGSKWSTDIENLKSKIVS